jgi:hypothetical protein
MRNIWIKGQNLRVTPGQAEPTVHYFFIIRPLTFTS